MSDLPVILNVKARSFPRVELLRDVGGNFLSLAHAEAHRLATSGAIKIYGATDSSKYCMEREAYCIFLAELSEFSNLGKGPRTMKVPYAKKWQKETDKLRQIALDCDLTEELKWGKPCFTFLKKYVAVVIPLKESCAFSFFKGALLKDPEARSRKDWRAYAGRAMD